MTVAANARPGPNSKLHHVVPFVAAAHLLATGFPRLLSALLFRNRALRVAWLPVPRFGCSPMNVRIYLADRDGRPGAVFFQALYLGSALLARLARPVVGVPFRELPFGIDIDRSGTPPLWRASSDDDAVRVTAREASPATVPDAATLDLLTNVHTGFVATPHAGGRSLLRTWSIWHRNQDVRLMSVDELRLTPLAGLGLSLGDPALDVLRGVGGLRGVPAGAQRGRRYGE